MKVVRGEVYGPKFSEPLDAMASGGVLLFLAAGLLMLIFGPGGKKKAMKTNIGVRLVGYALAGLMIVCAGLLAVIFLAIRWRRLVIGKDRIQLVGGFGRVLGQIPFANVDEVSNGLVVNVAKLKCYIRLKRRRHKGTWWPKHLSDREDFDIMIPTNLESDATAVHLHLRDALLKNRNHVT